MVAHFVIVTRRNVIWRSSLKKLGMMVLLSYNHSELGRPLLIEKLACLHCLNDVQPSGEYKSWRQSKQMCEDKSEQMDYLNDLIEFNVYDLGKLAFTNSIPKTSK